ncbi:endo-alpha-N-acetylgalactosaminidase family protein [Streptomyces sp. NBC_01304]|uniref:endo-alpha-N-acetylgalactosaminidase family protein n=1 Tax=Streptomyces sp. NBC_01304 TaxID=2903818 RepID=UPI002E155CBE|nr:endo-alpha-N-acetylgalactosaminidase family protein [Streptomyces sp. NBC_01304]
MSRRIRTVCAAAVASSLALALPAVAQERAAPAAAEGPVLTSDRLSVAVAEDFPRVVSYTDRASGARLLGSTRPVTEVTLNGKAYKVQVKGAPEAESGSAAYTLAFPDLAGVEIDAELSVRGRATTFKVTAVRDTEAFRVGTIDIPGHDLVSVGSDEQGAETAFTKLDVDSTKSSDQFGKVTGQTPADEKALGATYALVNTGTLAAAVESNATNDKPGGATAGDDARFWHQARKAADGSTRVGVWSGQWTYRGEGAPAPDKDNLPWAKVVVTPDANGDQKVDWQDGAVAFRTIGVKPKGGEGTADRVITHIPFNFASQAQHPFLRTLDDVKRISLATDGLGQQAVLKGYASEGHDSAHPDYGGNINSRAGGLKDLNKLLKEGEKWNATFGVHTNATEAYPEADAFDEQLVDKTKPGWNWLNQSYYIDQRGDLNSGNLAKRFKQLRDETDDNLSFIYMDVYYTHGWIAERTADAIKDQGWNLSTEWADKFERDSLWSHWANDLDYGPKTNKGLNSQIIRFIRNSEKDVWNDDPVLGQSAISEFEGWTGETDWNAFYANVWQRDLPAKFLQQEKITRWAKDDITFTGGLRGTVEDGRRTFYDHGRKVLDGDAYLVPWSGHRKLYHYNKQGWTTSWDAPAGAAYDVYRLTDNGRVKTGRVTATGGKVTLKADKAQPYVLYPVGTTPGQADADWGRGTPVDDPGFNDAGLDDWSTTGTAKRDTDGQGRNSAALSGAAEASISQQITGLEPGKRYSASAWIEVEPGKQRHTTLSAGGARATVERSTVANTVAGSDWHSTYMQRAKVTFTAPASGRTTFKVEAEKGSSAGGGAAEVRIDDVRIVRNAPATKGGTIAYEDFEDVDQGWGPLVKGDAGDITDPRTSLAKKHAPYTQAGWNEKLTDDVLDGDWSLKSHEENAGLVYRTAPWTVPMRDGRRYKVEFDYQNSHAGAYQWTSGYDRIGADGKPDSVETRQTDLAAQHTTAHFSDIVTAGCGDTWTGLRKLESAPEAADFSLDRFTVTDLGPAEEQAACGTLAVQSAETLEPGQKNEVKAVFTNYEAKEATSVKVGLKLPEGWSAEPAGDVTFDSVAVGEKATATWQVTPPVDAKYHPYELSSTASYGIDGTQRTLAAATTVRTLPPPPTVDTWASDLDWTASDNGWGPVEKDLSNGEQGEGDGTPLKIGTASYEKGLGTHAPATVRYYLGGKCTSFTAEVGIDEAQPTRGSAEFSVRADGTEKVKSPVLKAADAAWSLTADVSGAKYVDLVVGEGGDGNGNDHADWGSARFHCGG